MSGSVTILPATENDLAAIEDIFREDARLSRRQGKAPALGPYYPQSMKDYIQQTKDGSKRHDLLVAHCDSRVVGFVQALHRMAGRGNFTALHRWGVIEEYRGQGIGRALLDRVVEQSKALGKDHIDVHLPEGNPVELYEKLGFKKVRDIAPREEGRRQQELCRLAVNEKELGIV